MKSKGAWCLNELQWFDLKIGYQDSSPSNGHLAEMAHWVSQYKIYWYPVLGTIAITWQEW